MTWDWTPETLSSLEAFLAEQGVLAGPLEVSGIGDGHSNLTFLVTGLRDGVRESVVVRRPPPPPTPPGAHDMLREAQLLRALEQTTVPAPRVLATAQSGDVIDVALYVMTVVDGQVVTTGTDAPLAEPAARAAVGHALVDTLADLHAVDWRAIGLERFGRPEGFNRRHLERMRTLVAGPSGAPPAFALVEGWLATNAPAESAHAIVHNDYRIGNVILSTERPGTVAAVLDWELAALGDPLFDLGYFLASVPEDDEALTPTQAFGTAMLERGFPSRAELRDRYAERAGADLTHLDWYVVLAQWKLAVLYEYGRRRAVRGVGDPYYDDPGQVWSFLAAAHAGAGLPWADRPPVVHELDPHHSEEPTDARA